MITKGSSWFLPACGLLLAAASWCAADGSREPVLKFELTERFRVEATDNALALDAAAGKDVSYTRMRTSVLGRWTPNRAWRADLKLTNEFRYWMSPPGREFTMNEVVVDYLNVRWERPRFTLAVGRQDLFLGEGFVIADGGPLDGSRTYYFNAARLDWKVAPQGTLTFLYLYQPPTDTLLPVINDQDQPMVEQLETGYGVYFQGKAGTAGIEAYALGKTQEANEAFPHDSEFATVGARAVAPLLPSLTLTAEGAGQWGTFQDAAMAAYGCYATLDWSPGLRLPAPTTVTLGGIYLSGDDPATDDWEGWDPVFSRWPKWSESYIYTQAKEFGRPAYWSDLGSLFAGVKFQFGAPWDFKFTWHHLTAPQPSPASAGFADGGGNGRGELFINRLTYNDGKRLSGHLIWELFLPGGHYFDGADRYGWFRVELAYKL
jgi:hypothetical protein